MKQFFIAAFTGLISLGAQAQVTQTRTAKQVSSIEVKNGIELVFTQSDTIDLRVTANNTENLNRIRTDYKGGTLKIYLKDADSPTPIETVAKVYVSQKNVTNFTASHGALVRINGTLNVTNATVNLTTGATLSAIIVATGNCTIEARSGAGFRGLVTAKEFEASIVGGGYIRMGGKADMANVYCSSGSLNAGKFVCGTAQVWAQKASAVSIYTNDYIKTDVDASSSVTYYGQPVKTNLGTNAYAVKRDNYKMTLN